MYTRARTGSAFWVFRMWFIRVGVLRCCVGKYVFFAYTDGEGIRLPFTSLIGCDGENVVLFFSFFATRAVSCDAATSNSVRFHGLYIETTEKRCHSFCYSLGRKYYVTLARIHIWKLSMRKSLNSSYL